LVIVSSQKRLWAGECSKAGRPSTRLPGRQLLIGGAKDDSPRAANPPQIVPGVEAPRRLIVPLDGPNDIGNGVVWALLLQPVDDEVRRFEAAAP
jgi:hypothetical protein